jgi:hypothetical protein
MLFLRVVECVPALMCARAHSQITYQQLMKVFKSVRGLVTRTVCVCRLAHSVMACAAGSRASTCLLCGAARARMACT